MIAHRETRIVPHSADLMYRVVADVEAYPRFLPWVVALRLLSRRDTLLTAEMAVGYGPLRERYTSEVRLDPAARVIDVVQIPDGRGRAPFRTLENHWRFAPHPDGGPNSCEVAFSILFEFRSRLLDRVAGAKFEKVMLKLADAFEARAREIEEGRVT